MATLADLLAKRPGDILKHDEIILIGRLLSRKVTGSGVIETSTGWSIRDAQKGDKERIVLIRSVDLLINGYERDKILVQRVRYKSIPPVQGELVAYGEPFEVYPFEGHSYSAYSFHRSIRPLIGDLKDEVLNRNDFFTYRCRFRNSVWILEHVLRMPAGVTPVDIQNIDHTGGTST